VNWDHELRSPLHIIQENKEHKEKKKKTNNLLSPHSVLLTLPHGYLFMNLSAVSLSTTCSCQPINTLPLVLVLNKLTRPLDLKPTQESEIKAMEKSKKGEEAHTSAPSQQFKSEAPKDPIQEEGSLVQAKNDQLVDSPVSSRSNSPTSATDANYVSSNTSQQETLTNVFTTIAGTSTNTDTSTSTSQEQNQTSTITSGAVISTNNDVVNNNTSQEQTQIHKTTSDDIAETDVNTDTDTNNNAVNSNTIEEQTEILASKSSTSISGGASADPARGVCTGQVALPQAFTLIDTIPQETEIIRSMAAGFGNVLFTGSDNQIVRMWHKGQQSYHFQTSSRPVYAIALKHLPSYTRVFLAHNKREVSVWVISPRNVVFRQAWNLRKPCDLLKNLVSFGREHNNAISCLCLSDDFSFIYSGSVDCTLNTWHAQRFSSNPVDTIRSHRGAINALAVWLGVVFSGSSDGVIKMWKREQYGEYGEEKVRHLLIRTFHIQNEMVHAAVNAIVFWTADVFSGWLYAGTSDGNVRCWKNLSVDEPEADMHEPEVLSSHGAAVTCLALCSGHFIFSGSADKKICVWRRENEGADHTLAMVLAGHSDVVTCIAAQNDWEVNAACRNQWILYSGSLDRTLRIWRVYDHRAQTAAAGESRPVPRTPLTLSGICEIT
jgi:WD40 repeat protein